MNTQNDPFAWWRAALAGEEPPVHEGDPQAGFYRRRFKNKDGSLTSFKPVAIWQDANGQWLCQIGSEFGNRFGPYKADEHWTYLAKNPVPKAAYDQAMATGKWPDETGNAPKPPEPEPAQDTAPPRNTSDDPHQRLLDDLRDVEERAKELLAKPIDDEAAANVASDLVARLMETKKESETTRKEEKQPHLDAGAAVDAKWKPITEQAGNWATKLRDHLAPWLMKLRRAEEQRQREAQEAAQKAEAEAEAKRQAAEKARLDAEREAAMATFDSDEAAEDAAKAKELAAKRAKKEAEEAEKAARKANRQTSAKKTAAGRTGAKVSFRKVKSAEITDYNKLVEALKDRDEMHELVESLANSAARSGVTLDGMKIIETEVPV